MSRLFLMLGALSAFLGVALGAFGAHGLRDRIPADLLAVFEVGVRYQMYHALALLAVGLLLRRFGKNGSPAPGVDSAPDRVPETRGISLICRSGLRGPNRPEAAAGAATASCRSVPARAASSLGAASGWLFVAGTVIFSGSLYALSLSGIRWLGAITPIGGVAFLAGWLCLAIAAWRS